MHSIDESSFGDWHNGCLSHWASGRAPVGRQFQQPATDNEMATDVPSTVPADQAAAAGPEARQVVEHITVYSHSNLMYWWPVWLVCFILAGITYMGGNQMAVVPDGTVAVAGATISHPDHQFP